jgi:hypothetical protein
VYFNERFGVSAIAMRGLGVFNPEIGVDNRMFVDPKLLQTGKDEFANAHDELLRICQLTVRSVRMLLLETSR